MTAAERCDFSDLPVETCGCPSCRPDLTDELPAYRPIAYDGSTREARYAGRCGCGCGKPIREGDDIVLADLDGRGINDDWCLPEHTRSAWGGLL